MNIIFVTKQMKKYLLNNKEVLVCNSNYTDEVYIKSEIDLAPYFD